MKGLLLDFGGVLTTNVFDSFREFCVAEGLDPNAVRTLFRSNPRALELVRGLETGALSEDEFGERFGELLEIEDRAGLVDRMFGGIREDERMTGAVRQARAAGIRTGLVSNSMGAGSLSLATSGCTSRSRRSSCWGPSAPASRPRSACSSTTCARTARAPRRSA